MCHRCWASPDWRFTNFIFTASPNTTFLITDPNVTDGRHSVDTRSRPLIVNVQA